MYYLFLEIVFYFSPQEAGLQLASCQSPGPSILGSLIVFTSGDHVDVHGAQLYYVLIMSQSTVEVSL